MNLFWRAVNLPIHQSHGKLETASCDFGLETLTILLRRSFRDVTRMMRGIKNEMRYPQQAESSAIRFPKDCRSFLQDGNKSMYTLSPPNLYPGYLLAVSLISGQHSNRLHNSHILSNAVPLGFCCGGFSSTSGYAPVTKLNLR